jgi:acetyl-CoA carboxylase biotin carboxylase subunit
MFEKILIANRGEIALRIIRACKDMGIRSLAVYSEADHDSLHVQAADEAICIGPGPSAQSYLKIDRIISAAEVGDVDAIHPGYGFLSENAHFAEVCQSCNIRFIGPSPESIRRMGDKSLARENARKAGVPIPPGSDGPVTSEQEAIKAAKKIRMEAEKAFGNPDVYLEKYIEEPHHIEFQILGDKRGKIIHVGERDCSIQRRHQKLLEESPSPLLDNDLRKRMGKAAIKLAEAVQYENAGTMEFLVDNAGHYYFLEMNTRIQVEHPVTEEVYGVDLVKEQIKIAAGERLSSDMENLRPLRHAIEFRINAEDPANDFRPSPGTINLYYPPGGIGIRMDSHIYGGYSIPPFYDSMIGKLIAVGPDRATAVARMQRALDETIIRGVKTTIPLGQRIVRDQDFRRGKYSTHFLERFFERKVEPSA